MAPRVANRKEALLAAAVRLGAEGGQAATTIRAIARGAGVTDAAVYRHYRSKDDLLWRAYERSVEEMIREKRHLAHSDAPLREKLGEWVRLTYAYFDKNPQAFNFVLASPHVAKASDRSSTTGQGELFLSMITRAIQAGEARPMEPVVALSHFSGVLLNVPRLINEGALKGPASAYAEDVSQTAWRIVRPEVA